MVFGDPASSIPCDISFAPDAAFHNILKLLDGGEVPTAIRSTLQHVDVDPQVCILYGGKQEVISNFCKEAVAHLGAVLLRYFLDFPPRTSCAADILKAMHLDFLASRSEFVPHFLSVCQL